jgi:hypothetical protein
LTAIADRYDDGMPRSRSPASVAQLAAQASMEVLLRRQKAANAAEKIVKSVKIT